MCKAMSVQTAMEVEQGGMAMDCTAFLNIPRNNCRISEAANNSESTTMIRLHEVHVNAGSARQKEYAGKQRRIVNQHNAQTVGHYILSKKILSTMGNEDDLKTKLNYCCSHEELPDQKGTLSHLVATFNQ
jgi:hypothetical protein